MSGSPSGSGWNRSGHRSARPKASAFRGKPQRQAFVVIVVDDFVAARELEHDFLASQTFDVKVVACLTAADGANAARDPSVTALLVAEHCVLGGMASLRRLGVTCPVFALAGEPTEEQRAWLVATGYVEAIRFSDLNRDLIDSIVLLALQLRQQRKSDAAQDPQRLGDAA